MDRSTKSAIESWLAIRVSRPLAVYVTLEVETLPRIAGSIQRHFEFLSIPIGKDLGEALLDSPPGRRVRDTQRWLQERCAAADDRPLLLTDVDLLFHAGLDRESTDRLDQMALLARASHIHPLLVMWPGSFDGATLSYAVPEHGHYQYWRRPGAHVIHTQVGAAA